MKIPFRVDLHIHTGLSPCADAGMVPTAIIEKAKEQKLDGIGICDHNSAENVVAVRKAGARAGVQVLGGMEITSREEVHVMGFFQEHAALFDMQEIVYENLPGKNDQSVFGEQIVVDEHDRIVGASDRLLIGATDLSVDQIVASIHRLGGVAIASHIDRESFGIIGQLGFVPPELPLDALELSSRCRSSEAVDYWKYGLPLVTFSDAHYPSDMGGACTTFVLDTPSVAEVVRTLRGRRGRKKRI
ncbi:MAG: PHP domain-containing protein [Candidatus Latescibacterota bacterium]